MREKLEKLLALQELDLEIRKLERDRRSLEETLEEEKQEQSVKLQDFENEKAKLKKLHGEVKELEIDLESLQSKRKKLEEQQAAVKTNQEYKALNKEILDALAEVDRNEEKLIKKLDEIEAEKGRLKDLEEKVKQAEEKLKADLSVIQKEIDEINASIAGLNEKRGEIMPGLDSRTIRIYTKVFERTGGPAVVPVNNRTCGGCHLSITPQVENLTRRNEELILCENCSRILYYKPEEEDEPAKSEA